MPSAESSSVHRIHRPWRPWRQCRRVLVETRRDLGASPRSCPARVGVRRRRDRGLFARPIAKNGGHADEPDGTTLVRATPRYGARPRHRAARFDRCHSDTPASDSRFGVAPAASECARDDRFSATRNRQRAPSGSASEISRAVARVSWCDGAALARDRLTVRRDAL
jgi:hypothetical protein